MALIVAAAVFGRSASRSPITYDDEEPWTRHPLTTGAAYSAGVWAQWLGQPYTASVSLEMQGHRVARLERVRLVARSSNLEVLGVLAAGPERGLVQAIGAGGFPPERLPRSMHTRYRPIEEVPVTDRQVDGFTGTDVIIGVRFQTGTRAWFDGIEVTYTVDGQRYIGRFAVAWAMCTYHPCPTPQSGKPWGDER